MILRWIVIASVRSGIFEFKTVDDIPIYYGGDLYDSDKSDWKNPRNLAYAEYVDLYNFAAPEGMELKVFERSQEADWTSDDGG